MGTKPARDANALTPLPTRFEPRQIAVSILLLVCSAGGIRAETAYWRPFLPWESWLLGREIQVEALGEGIALEADETWRLTLESEMELLLRDRGPTELHDYRREALDLGARRRWRDLTFHLFAARRRSEGRQRNVYSEEDALTADLIADFAGLGAAGSFGAYDLELGLEHGRDWGGHLALSRTFEPGRLRLYLGLWRTEWDLDQSFTGRRYRFSFPFRREILGISFQPEGGRWPRLGFLREVVADESTQEGDWNQIYALRHGLELGWPVGRDAAVELGLSVHWGQFEMAMFADGDAYLRLPGLNFRHHEARLSWRLPKLGGSVLLSQRETRLDAIDGFFEPWPFSFWDIFQNNRYMIDGLYYRLTLWSLGYARDFDLGTRGASGFAVRHIWLTGGGSLDWKERVPVLPPFFFRWDRHHEILQLPATHAVRLDLKGELALGARLRLILVLTQHVPLRTSGGTDGGGPPSAPVEEDRFRYGGFAGRLSLEVRP